MSAPSRRACVIGHPVAHSRSPLIHGYWLRERGIPGAYERVDVEPRELRQFLTSLEDRGYVGANVTVPHKEAALGIVDEATQAARAVGAVNTVWLEQGGLHGDNTDVSGFLAHLDETAPDWRGTTRRAVVLGAGGAARAVVHALLARDVEQLTIVNRDHDRASALAAHGSGNVVAARWSDRSSAAAGADLVVNTTSLGMKGQPPLDIDLGGVAASAIVYDIVYVPLETPLLGEARARGLRAVDGLGMLLHQAVPGFTRWFGVRPEVTPRLRAEIVADILSSP